jgi:hypothetical protein
MKNYTKKIYAYCFLAIGLLAFTSCGPTALIGNVAPTQVKDMVCFLPASSIGVIEKGDKALYDARLSDMAMNNFVAFTKKENCKKWLHLSNDTLAIDSTLHNAVYDEQFRMLAAVTRSQSVQNVNITPLIDSLLEKSGKRYGLIYYQNGFTRTKGNRSAKTAESLGIGLLTLGMAIPISYPAGSTMHCIIVDAQTNKVVFYHFSTQTDQEPYAQTTIEWHLVKIFNSFFKERQ